MLISCFIKDLESFGAFIGAHLAMQQQDDLQKFKNSVDFYNSVSAELEKFLDRHEYNLENIEKWVGRYVILFKILCFSYSLL